MKIRKRLRFVQEEYNQKKVWTLQEAITFLKKHATAKFDETIEVCVRLGIDPQKADQHVRGVVALPQGTGRKVRIAVFCRSPKDTEALSAGADIVGAEDLEERIQKGILDFDRCIATPDLMPIVGRLGKILGPKGLMPNPKSGTVTSEVGAAVAAIKSGQIEYRSEKAGIVHSIVGKASFSGDALLQNISAFMQALLKSKPSGLKGDFIRGIALSSTMGMGLHVRLDEAIKIGSVL